MKGGGGTGEKTARVVKSEGENRVQKNATKNSLGLFTNSYFMLIYYR